MKQLYLFISPILVTCFIGKTPVSAQNIATDSSNNQVAFYKAVSFYHQSLKPEAGLYNGIQYRPYDQTLKEGQSDATFEKLRFSLRAQRKKT